MKRSDRREKRNSVIISLLLLSFVFVSSYLYALPENPETVSGEVKFEKINDTTLNITASDQSIINYQSFNIGANETVNFLMPGVNAFSLNRVIGGTPSQILGRLTANGNIILVNVEGIHFGSAAQIEVGGLIASTRDISNQNFLQGRYIFGSVEKDAQKLFTQLVNDGKISTREGGFAVLIGSAVQNNGTVCAPLGTASLASGDVVTVGISGDGLVSIAIDQPVSGEVIDLAGNKVSDQISNTGAIQANGGHVIIKADAAREVFHQAVNLEGHVQADRAVMKDGAIEIVASGPIQADATVSAEGGEIIISSDEGLEVQGTYQAPGGTVAFEAGEDIAITGEMNTSGDTTLTAQGDIAVNGDITTDSGDLRFRADSDMDGEGAFLQAPDTTVKTTTYGDITISSSGESTLANIESAGDLTLEQAGAPVTYTQHAGSAISTQGSLTINPGATLKAADTTYEIARNWINLGNFIPDVSTVKLVGPGDAEIRGQNTFYNLIIIEPGKTVSLEAGVTQKVVGTLTFQGGFGKLLTLRSTEPTVNWKIDAQGLADISFVRVMNSTNVNIHGPPLAPTYSQNSSPDSNSGWDFTLAGPVWTGFSSLDWSDPLNWDGGFVPSSGDIVRFNSLSSPGSFVDAGFSGSVQSLILESGYAGTLTLGRDLTVSQDVTLAGGTFSAGSQTITVGGNWSNLGGNFDAGTSTVIFNDSSRITTISGNNTFYNFICETPEKIIQFEAGKTQTILSLLKIQGAYAQHIRLISTEAGNQWKIDPQDLRDITYAWVEDSYNLSPVEIIMTKSTNRGNSHNWDPVFTWIGPANGNWSNAANWDGGGSTPGAGDDVVFDGTFNTNSTVDSGFTNSIGSLTLDSGYTSTITLQAPLTITTSSGRTGNLTINSGKLDTQAQALTVQGNLDISGGELFIGAIAGIDGATNLTGGSFSITNSSIVFTGAFTQSGGNFDASYEDMTFASTFTQTNGTFTIGGSGTGAVMDFSGTLLLEGGTFTAGDGQGTLTFADFTQTGGTFDGLMADMTINGNFSLSGDTATFKAPANANNGHLTFAGNFSHSGTSTFDHNSGAVTFQGGATTVTVPAGGENFNHLTLNKSDGAALTIQQLNVSGTLTLADGALNSGTINATGNVSFGTAFDGGTGTINISGTSTQSINLESSGIYPKMVLASSLAIIQGANGGSVTINGLEIQSGTFKGGYCTITFAGDVSQTAGRFDGEYSTLIVNGNLTVSDGDFTAPNSTGLLDLKGNVSFAASTFTHNSGTIKLSGTAAQTVETNNNQLYNLTVTNNSSGGVEFLDGLNMGVATSNFTAGTPNTKLIFNAGATYSFYQITINGQSPSTKITLRSSTPGTAYKFSGISIGGGGTFKYLDIKDCDASAVTSGVTAYHSKDSGGNSNNWTFEAQNIYWSASSAGNWFTVGNWSGGEVPGDSDNVFFTNTGAGHCTLDGDVAINSLTMEDTYTGTVSTGGYDLTTSSDMDVNGGTLEITSGSLLKVGGNLDMNSMSSAGKLDASAGSIDIDGNVYVTYLTLIAPSGGDFFVGGTWEFLYATFTPGTGTVTFNGTGTQTLRSGLDTGANPFYNLTHSGSGTLSLSEALIVNNTFTNSAGTFDMNGQTATFRGDWNNTGSAAFTRGNIETNLIFDGASTIVNTSSAAASLGFIIINNGKSITLGSDLTITKLHYDHTGGTVNLGTGGYTLTVTGDGQTSGTPLMCTLVAGTNSTVKYTGTNYTDIQNHNYHHLQLSGAGPYYLNGNTTLSGNLTIDSGATLYAENNNDSTVYALTLAGNWTNNGTFQASSGTVTFNGTGTQTLESGNSPFYNLIHSGTGTLSLSNDPLIVANDFRKTGSGTFTAGANNITAKNVILSAGSFNAPSGNFSISGNFYIDAALASFDANSGNIIFAGSNDQIFTTNGMTFNNIELNNSSANDDLIVNGTLKLSGNLTVTDGTLDLGTNSASAEIGGNLTIESAGTFLKGSSLTFTGSGDINDKTTASQDLGNVTIGGTSTIRTLQNNVKMTGLTVNSGCIFVLNGKNLSFSSSAAAVNNGTIRLNGNETLTNVTSLDTDSGTVEYEGDGDATSDEYDIAKFGATTSYYDLIINDLSTTKDTFKSSTAAAINGSLTIISGTFKAPVDTLTISGNFSNSGTFEHSNGTVTFNKTTGTQTLDSGGYNFSTIIHSGAGTLQLTGNPLTVISSFSNNAGTFDLNGQDWVMTGADFSNTGTVQLRGSENLTDVLNDFSQGTWIYVGGSGSPFTVKDFGTGYDYYNLIISAADSSYTFQCANEIKIAGDLTLNDGVFDANGQAVTVEGTATLVAGEYLSKSGTQTFNGDLVLSASGKLTGSNTGTITVGGNITIASGAEFVLPTTLNLAGDWSNSGTVDATTYNSSVYLTGGNQTISGETTFYGLSKTTFTACSLKFEKGKKQTVTAQLTFSGMSGELLSLLSTEDGTQWKFEYTGGSPTLNYLAVRDSYNEGGTLSASNSTGIANNYGWDFGGISNLFWIGPVSGTYYWTDNYWSTTSGGTAAGYYPGSTHTAIFDNNGYSCTLASNETVANLTLQSGYTGTLNFDSGGYTLTVMSDLTVGGGTFDASNGSLDIGGNVAVSGGELKAPTSRDFTVAGNWTKTGGTFTPGAGTVTFDGGSGVTQEITPGSASFYNFTHSGAGTVSLLGDFDVDHTFSNSAGTFDEQNQNVSFGGNWENKNSAAYTRGNGTMTFDGDATLTDSSSNAGNLGIITVTSPATLTLGSDAAADSVTGTGTLNLGAGGYILTLTGSGTPLGINSFQKGTGSTVKYAGSSATTVKAAQYNNLQFSGTGTYSLSGNLTSTYALTGDLTVDNGATLDVSGNNYGIELAGNFTNSGTFTARSGTVTFSGGSGVTQTLTPGSSGFYDIAHSGAGTLRLEGDLSVYSISNTGIFELNGKNWTMTGGSLSNDGTVRLQGNEALNGLSQDADSGTWEYVGDGDGTSETFDILDSGSGDFYNLIINDTHATKDTFRATAPLKIYNDFTVSGGTYYANGQATTVDGACAVNTGGTYTAGSGTQIFNGLLSISGGTFTGGTGAIAANGGLSMTSGTLTAPSGAFTAGGDWTISGGTFNPGTGTVNFNKSSGTQTLTPGGKSFYNLTHSGNGTLTLGGALTVTGTLTHSAGTFDAGANAIDANGNVTLSSGTFTAPSSTFNIGGNLDLTYLSTFNANNGTIIFDGSASQSLTTNSKTFNHIELNNTGTSGNDKLTVSGNLDINGNFTLTDGTLDLAANNPDVRLAGNLSVAADAAITKGTGYFYFDGASAQTWSDLSSGQDLGNVQIEGNVSTITNVTAEKITIKAAKSLDITDDTLTLTGTANLLVNFGTFTATDSTVVYTGSGATITIPQVPYHHLTLSPSTATTFKLYGNLTGSYALTGDLTIGNNATLDVIQGTSSHYDIELAGNWTNNGTFTARTGTVTFTGGTGVTQALKSGGSGFCKLTHSGAGTLELQDALTVTNTLTNSAGTFTAGSNQIDANGKVTLSGGTFNAPSTNFYISGNEFNLTNLTDFNDNDGTVIFDNFSGTLLVSDGKSLGNVQIGSSTSGGELILGDPASFTGNLTVEAGNTTSFTLGGFVLTFSGQTFDLTNLDTFDTAGSTVVFSGTSAQEVTSNSLAYDILRVTNTTAAVKFLDAFTANTFRATGGNSEIRFKENTAYGITTLDINGQSSATRIILDSIDQTNSFTIALTSSQTVYYVDARNSDAIGDSINAQNSVGTNCNSNWIFGGSGVTRYWVGPVSSGLWNDNNYWAETSGGTGGFSSPGSGDTAIFDGGNVNDCTLDADVTIYQLTLASGYSGTLDTGIYDLTITQNAEIAGGTLTVGTGKTLGVDATLTVSGGLLDGQNGIIDANHIAITGGELKAPASGDFFVSGDWTHTGGTLTHDNGEITFTGGAPATIDVNSNETFYDLTFEKDDGVAITLAAGDSVIATGVLTLSDGKVDAETGAKMEAQNNANVSSSFDGGTAPLHFTGTADQNFNLTAATDKFDGNITVNKTSGTVQLISDLLMNASGQDFTLTDGTFDANGYDLSIEDALTIANGQLNIPADSGLSVGGLMTVSGGTLNAGGGAVAANGGVMLSGGTLIAPATGLFVVKGDWTNSGGTFTSGTGTVTFGDTSSQNLTSNGESFYNLTHSGSGTLTLQDTLNVANDLTNSAGTIDTNGKNVAVGQDLNVNTGTFTGGTGSLDVNRNVVIASGATLIAPTGTFTVAGDWTKGGTFAHSNGTVTFDGTDQAITGSSTFCNLSKINSGTLTFAAGSTQIIAGALSLKGSSGNLLTLKSSIPGASWNIDPQGTRDVTCVDVGDSNNLNATKINAVDSTDSGNNTNWEFTSSTPDNSSSEPPSNVSEIVSIINGNITNTTSGGTPDQSQGGGSDQGGDSGGEGGGGPDGSNDDDQNSGSSGSQDSESGDSDQSESDSSTGETEQESSNETSSGESEESSSENEEDSSSEESENNETQGQEESGNESSQGAPNLNDLNATIDDFFGRPEQFTSGIDVVEGGENAVYTINNDNSFTANYLSGGEHGAVNFTGGIPPVDLPNFDNPQNVVTTVNCEEGEVHVRSRGSDGLPTLDSVQGGDSGTFTWNQ